jgi:hypothetical protein
LLRPLNWLTMRSALRALDVLLWPIINFMNGN